MSALDEHEERTREFRKLRDDYKQKDDRVKQLCPVMTQPLGTEIPNPIYRTPDEGKRCLEAMDDRREADQRLRDFMGEWFGIG